MVKRGTLNVPVIGVAKAGWNRTSSRRGRRTVWRNTAGSIPKAFDKLCGLLRYVDGDYNDAATFQALRREMGPRSGPPITWPFRPPRLKWWWNNFPGPVRWGCPRDY